MFYSHEILTSRKYGVATIWLVATLGQNSLLKKVGRKEILDVNVSKACEVIITPSLPMALRLQSALLYGLSRVYSQQCGYVLSDAQAIHNSIRHLLASVSLGDIDTSTKAKYTSLNEIIAFSYSLQENRPQDLMRQDDPFFMLDIGLPLMNLEALLKNPDSINFGFGTQTSVGSRKSPSSSNSQYARQPEIMIPSDYSPVVAGDVVYDFSSSFHIMAAKTVLPHDIVLEDAEFELDEEGRILELPPRSSAESHTPLVSQLPDLGSGGSTNVYRAQSTAGNGQIEFKQIDDMEFDLPRVDDGYDVEIGDVPSSTLKIQTNSSTSFVVSHETEEMVAAPLQRTRVPKHIPADTTLELRNRNMIEQNNKYIENMRLQQKEHLLRLLSRQAKQNADHFILGRGINGIGKSVSSKIQTPLSMFCGNELYEWATGIRLPLLNSKRGQEDSDSDTRRVRPRDDGYEFGRAGEPDDYNITMLHDDEVELPRERAIDLTDVSSIMPWNISASGRGSSASRVGSALLLSSATRRSHLISASPLHGLGPSPAIDEEGFRMIDAFEDIPGSEPPREEESDVFNPVKMPNVALDIENSNFLVFVKHAIERKQKDVNQLGAQLNADPQVLDRVTLDELFPPKSNSRAVAAHGILQVLSLATKNLIIVEQSEQFGPVFIALL